MKNYLAKYVVNAGIFDGGVCMPDPEPHLVEYNFEALDEAKKKAEEYKREVAKDYFGVRNITLDDLFEIKKINLKQKRREIKRVSFDEELGFLVDQENNKYEGKRFATRASSSKACCLPSFAEEDALFNLETRALEEGADTYELLSVRVNDSRQEYDDKPYSATATAILYKG